MVPPRVVCQQEITVSNPATVFLFRTDQGLITLRSQTYPAMPCPLSFAEEVAVRAGMLDNAAILASAGMPGAISGGLQLVSLLQVLPPRFRSWQRPPVDVILGSPAQGAAVSAAQQ